MSLSDLTTTANVKTFLGIATSTDDALIGRLVSGASNLILAWLGRDVFVKSYTEVRDGTGTAVLTAKQFPIISVQSLFVDNVAITLAPNSNAAGYGFDDKRLWLNGQVFRRGTRNVILTYTAGLTTAGATQQVNYEYHTIPASAPYTITAAQAPYYDTDLGVVFVANGAALTDAEGPPAAGQYDVNESTGVYTFAAADAGKAVALTYLYFFPVPQAIEQACIELVAAKYKLRTRVGVTSQTIAGETINYSVKDIPEEVRGALQQFRQTAPV